VPQVKLLLALFALRQALLPSRFKSVVQYANEFD
jgi:hypothetical protein